MLWPALKITPFNGLIRLQFILFRSNCLWISPNLFFQGFAWSFLPNYSKHAFFKNCSHFQRFEKILFLNRSKHIMEVTAFWGQFIPISIRTMAFTKKLMDYSMVWWNKWSTRTRKMQPKKSMRLNKKHVRCSPLSSQSLFELLMFLFTIR